MLHILTLTLALIVPPVPAHPLIGSSADISSSAFCAAHHCHLIKKTNLTTLDQRKNTVLSYSTANGVLNIVKSEDNIVIKANIVFKNTVFNNLNSSSAFIEDFLLTFFRSDRSAANLSVCRGLTHLNAASPISFSDEHALPYSCQVYPGQPSIILGSL